MYGALRLPTTSELAWFSSTTTTMCENRGTAATATDAAADAPAEALTVGERCAVGAGRSAEAGGVDGRPAGEDAALQPVARTRTAAANRAISRICPWCPGPAFWHSRPTRASAGSRGSAGAGG